MHSIAIVWRRRRKFCLSVSLWPACILFLIICNGAIAQPTNAPDKDTQITALNVEMNAAIEKAKVIINQKVGALRRTPGMKVIEYKDGWFHPGATKPNFLNVDVRTSRETPYDQYPYVTSDLNAGYVFIGSHLEFNSMTKYFYTDRTVPKKKLTEAEMIEVNRLYRIIGTCERKIRLLQAPLEPIAEVETEMTEAQPERKYEPVPKGNYIKAAVGVSAVLGLYLIYRWFAKTSQRS